MAKTLTLYTNPQSRGRIARWALEETGESYETVWLDYDTTMKAPEYLAINPMGKVPALGHGDQVVTECAAICAYLAEAFPAADLAPTPSERADYFRWLFFTAGPLEAAVVNSALGFEVSAEQQRMAGWGNLALAIDAIDGALASRDFITGSRFTAADVYVGAQIAWGLEFGSLEARPNFERYAARVTARPAYEKAIAIDLAALEGS